MALPIVRLDVVLRERGGAVGSGNQVEVQNLDGTPATLYTDTSASSTLDSIQNTDADGRLPGYIEIGTYQLQRLDGLGNPLFIDGAPAPVQPYQAVSGNYQRFEVAGSEFVEALNVRSSISCPVGVLTPTTLIPVPELVPGQTKMIIGVAVQLKPLAGCTQIVPSVDEVTVAGGWLGNLGFWLEDQHPVGNWWTWAASCPYDPRLTHLPDPDVDLDDGAGRYIGLNVTPQGGDCVASSAHIFAEAAIMPAITIDNTSAGFLDDVN